jgi:osmotically-inducible protein OsmY
MKRCWILGVVGLMGALGGCSPAERADMKDDVRQNVKGVRQQMNNAADSARERAANATVASRVENAVESRKGLESLEVKVEAKDGHIVLKGDVASTAQADLAERVALETEGVETVDNQLMLRMPAKSGATQPGSSSTY